jgi:hypothetical protein
MRVTGNSRLTRIIRQSESEDTMRNALKNLGPFHSDRQREDDQQKAAALLCPQHPRRKDVQLRAGIDKRGAWWFFEPIDSLEGSQAWRRFERCGTTRQSEILSYDDRGELGHRQGPAGCILLYYEPDS